MGRNIHDATPRRRRGHRLLGLQYPLPCDMLSFGLIARARKSHSRATLSATLAPEPKALVFGKAIHAVLQGYMWYKHGRSLREARIAGVYPRVKSCLVSVKSSWLDGYHCRPRA